MSGTSLFALLDDIATILDDVSMAAKKTAGVLGDDLALNAEKVTGVRAERELPVVWAVFKGSVKNKFILVPIALLLSVYLDWLIVPLLLLGGLYLCFEGFEKVFHPLLHSKEHIEKERNKVRQAVADPKLDMVEFEQNKIKGAIRTDFILSAEIIVITLGTVQEAALMNRIAVVVLIAALMTIVVYGLVAGIVRLDDVGQKLKDSAHAVKQKIGGWILSMAPYLMKTLSVVGTIAMFLVGGGIVTHSFNIHTFGEIDPEWVSQTPVIGDIMGAVTPTLFNGLIGLIAGALSFVIVAGAKKLLPKKAIE